jgi:flagellar assembly factor FliW
VVDQAQGADPEVLTFDGGIPGFAAAERFTIGDFTVDGTFQLLQSLDDPELSLVVTSPWLFFPDYGLDLPEFERRELGIEDPTEALVFCSVIAEDTEELFLNLRAPFVANARTRAARQVVLDDPELPLRALVSSGG